MFRASRADISFVMFGLLTVYEALNLHSLRQEKSQVCVKCQAKFITQTHQYIVRAESVFVTKVTDSQQTSSYSFLSYKLSMILMLHPFCQFNEYKYFV